jgi:hypothetical protein
MFWTETLIQKTLFDGDEILSSKTVSQLIRFAEETFPNNDSNFHRHVAFLTHYASQNFLRPMLLTQYGSLDEAKVPTLNWLESLGSLETFARSTRACNSETRPAPLAPRGLPSWYQRYLASDHYQMVKREAECFWVHNGKVHCSINARHEYEVMHHSCYGRIGEADEFRFLVPLCHSCHASISAKGPRVSATMPEAVKKWITAMEMSNCH